MATLNSAVQAIVDNLHSKMVSNTPLTAEEQTLVASAIEKLSNQTNWENALIAVAEQHLDTATNNMSATLTTATNALSSAQSDINTARNAIQTQNANLALIPDIQTNVQTSLDGFGQANSTELKANLAAMSRPVFGYKLIESYSTSGEFQRGQAVFAIYSENGDTFVVRPSFNVSTTSEQRNMLQYLKLAADGSSTTTIKSHYVHSSTFYATPTSYIYRYGTSAILPLASKDNADDIAYEVVYSTADSATSSAGNYAGIFCASAGNTTKTKPKQNINAVDKFGISSVTNYNWNDVAVLYDNNKHCLVVVDDSTSLLVEKYRDGNVITSTSIPNSSTLQGFVNSGDYTVVKFISHHLSYPHCIRRYDGVDTNVSISHYADCYGFYGSLGTDLKMGGSQYNAHYRFTSDKKLEPLNFFFTSSVSQNRTQGTSGTANAIADVQVALTDMQGNTLGIYHYQSKADYAGHNVGYIAGAIMCMNPYSHVGILNEGYMVHANSHYYGQGRIAKAF